MIHFDFKVSDEDAETIMSCLSDRVSEMHEWIMEDMVTLNTIKNKKAKKNAEAKIRWYRAHIVYIEELKNKMTNSYEGSEL